MHWLHFGAREQMHAGKPSGGDSANGSHKESTKELEGKSNQAW